MVAPTQSHHCVDCPRCDRHTMIQRSDSLFVCLHCGYREDSSDTTTRGALKFLLMVAGLVLFIALL